LFDNNNSKFTYNIFRKPTATSTTLHNTSCHPHEHKWQHLHTYKTDLTRIHLQQDGKYDENNITEQMAHENGYNETKHDHAKNQ
jgi:hypothetical protein